VVDDQDTTGVTSSVREISEARQDAGDWLAQARADPNLQPSAPGFGGDELVARVHSSVFRFFDTVRPYRSGVRDTWHNDEIGTFELRVYDETRTIGIGNLKEFGGWRNREIPQTKQVSLSRPGNPSETETRRRRVFLPLTVLQSAYDTLCDAVVKADLAARLPEQRVDAEPL
jgi:hypothetical protein